MAEPQVVVEGCLRLEVQEGGFAEDAVYIAGNCEEQASHAERLDARYRWELVEHFIVPYFPISEREKGSGNRFAGPVRITASPGRIVIERMNSDAD